MGLFHGLRTVMAFLPLAFAAHAAAQFEWSSVGDGPGGAVFALAVFDDGTGDALYAGGLFGLKKWDGSDWVTIGPLVGFPNAEVRALEVYDDGGGPALYVGGHFLVAGGVVVNSVAKWDGTTWSGMGTGIDSVFPIGLPGVHALKWYDDGNGPALYAGGHFNIAGGVSVNSIAKWNGTTWSALGNGVTTQFLTFVSPGVVHSLEVFDDGAGPELYVGGTFEFVGSQVSSPHIARWNGSSWSPIGAGNFFHPSHAAFAQTVFDYGAGPALMAGGTSTWFGGSLGSWLGGMWSGHTTVLGVSNSAIHALAVYDDGTGEKLYIGGNFLFLIPGPNPSWSVVSWDGTTFSTLLSCNGKGVANHVVAMAVHDDGTGEGNALYIGGSFTQAGGNPAPYVACWGCPVKDPEVLAVCQDVVISADALCTGTVFAEDVGAKSFGPDGVGLTLALDPPGPFPLGETIVTLAATPDDPCIASDSCKASILVVDDTPPTIWCPDDVVAVADAETCDVPAILLEVPETADNCGVAGILFDAPTSFPLGTTSVTWTAIDETGNESACVQLVTILDETPPVISCPPDVVVSANPGSCEATGLDLGLPDAFDNCGDVALSNDAPAVFPLGTTTVTWWALDASGNESMCEQTVTVEDQQPPSVAIATGIEILWPPNHHLINIGLSVAISDNCDESEAVTSWIEVYSNEDDEEPTGVGVHSPDAKDFTAGALRLRSERKGDGQGRVYLIVVYAEDSAGNIASAATAIIVPKSMSPAAIAFALNMAAAAVDTFTTTGSPPAGYHVVGDGPVVGPFQ